MRRVKGLLVAAATAGSPVCKIISPLWVFIDEVSQMLRLKPSIPPLY